MTNRAFQSQTKQIRATVYTLLLLMFTPVFCSCDSASKFLSPQDVKDLANIRALSGTLKPGTTYDEKQMPRLTPKGHWIKIPKWLAGVWESEDFTMYYNATENGPVSKETRNFPFVHKQTFGHKMDSNGDIWHCTLVPFLADQKYGDDSAVKQITWKAQANVKDGSVIITFYTSTVDVNKKNKIILDISKNISEQTYSQKNEKQLLCVTNQFGESVSTGKYRKKTRMQLFKKAEFKERKELEGVDLDKSFASFTK